MTLPLNVIAVSGSTALPSRTLALAESLLAELSQRIRIRSRAIHLGDVARDIGGVLYRHELPAPVERVLADIEAADLLMVASPVYRGSLPGHLKHLFDLIGQDALIDKPVLLAATGGSGRHALVIDHQLRPLFSFFQALTLPIGVYASTRDFHEGRVRDEALKLRIKLAADRAANLLLSQRPVLSAAA
jgi:FMN reductase